MLTVIPMVTKKEIAREYTQKEMRKEFKHLTIKNQLNTKDDGNQEMRDKNLSDTCRTDSKMTGVSYSLSVITFKVSHQKTNTGRMHRKCDPTLCYLQETNFRSKDTNMLKLKSGKRYSIKITNKPNKQKSGL